MGAALVETFNAEPGANRRRRTKFPPFNYIPNIRPILAVLWLLGCLALSGCGSQTESAPPTFIGGTNYAAVPTNSPAPGMPQSGIQSLYHYPNGPKGPRSLVWPYITAEDQAVFGNLIVFNGGLTDDITWKYYPALLAYAGNGSVVDISPLATRHIPRWKPDWNYSFAILSVSNGFVRLDASQRLPMEADRPKRIEVDLNKNEILQAVLAAQTNAEIHNFNGVKYFIVQ